jgi:molecular chaperone DnaJ
VRERCPECRGQGRFEREKTIELRIPPGVDTGTRLRVAGEGEPGPNGGPAGDLYVVLEVKEHPFFERRGADLYCTIPISVAQATLGTELQVPGLNGEEKLKIPEGTQSGAVFRIKGKGLADPRGGGKGDLYYHVRVLTPTKLTREQRKLVEQLGATLKVENKPADRNSTIFDKVKDIFG